MPRLIAYKSYFDKTKILLEKDSFVEEINLSKELYSIKPLHEYKVAVFVNGTHIHPDDWHLFQIEENDFIEIYPEVGKNALPWVGAFVSMGLFLSPFSGATWATWGSLFTSGGFLAGLAKSAAIGYALGSIANSILYPMSLPSISGYDNGSDSEYSWAGSMLVTQPDGPVNVTYGQYALSGTLIMQYVDDDLNENNEKCNYLYMLIALGEGEIEGIMKEDESEPIDDNDDDAWIKINNEYLSRYQSTDYDYRTGTQNQTATEGFHNTSTFYSDERRIVQNSPITYTTTGLDIEEFEVNLMVPNLFFQNSRGDIYENVVDFNVKYRVVGEPTWTDAGNHSIKGKSKSPLYRNFSFPSGGSLEKNQYEIRIARMTPEYTSFSKGGDLYLYGITEITHGDIAYRNTSVLSLKLEATEQLSGSIPDVRVLIRGLKVKVPKLTITGETQIYDDCYWDDEASEYKLISNDSSCVDTGDWVEQWSRNPIWCTRDFMTNKRYGLGEYIDEAHFDDDAARIEAKYCWQMVDDLAGGTNHRFELDITLSRFTSATESLKLLARSFRGWIIPSGRKYKPVIDRPQDAVQIFNSSNMDPKSLKTTYVKRSQTANLIQLQFANPDRDYAVETREVPDDDEWTESKPFRPKTINARGTTRLSQVLRDGKYALNCEKYCDMRIEFNSDMDTIKCEPGDTIRFQNDLVAWGVGGRVVSATSSSVTVNIDVTYVSGYQIRVRLPDSTLEVKTVSSITNNNRTLNISGSFTATPLKDSIWTYGAESVDSKPFKVVSIVKTPEQKCQLTCIDESANKYLDTLGISIDEPIYTSLPNPSGPPNNINDLTLTEMSNQPGFYISFTIPTDVIWHHVDFAISLDYLHWTPIRSNVTIASDIEVINLKPGLTYYVRGISYNRIGIANLDPVIESILLTWSAFRPPNVRGLRLDGESSLGTNEYTTKDPKFVWKKTSLTSGAGRIPAGREELGAGQFYDDIGYKFLVEIYVSGIKVRKEILNDNYYTYTYEKNVLDNGTAQSIFTIYVWGYNEEANLKSLEPTTLKVSNPAPAAVSSLTAVPWMRGVKFTWAKNTEIDLDYYTYRTKVETDDWTDWIKTTNLYYTAQLTSDNIDDHGGEARIYIEVKAVDTFGNESTAQSADATATGLVVGPTDIDDFAITASKIFTKIPILEGDTWTNDTPDGNSVTWNTHNLYYNGVAYPITGDHTDKKYIYWINGESTYSSSDTHPKDDVPLTNEDFIIAVNVDGEASLAWNAIANQVIGSAYIQHASIVDAHISNMSGDKILLASNLAINSSTWQQQGFQVQYNSGTPRMYCGNGSTKYIQFDGSDVSINNANLTAGALISTDWATDAGVKFDLTNKWIKMGGSDVDEDGSVKGVFLGYDDDEYKFYVGDGEDQYLRFDGNSVYLSGNFEIGITDYIRTIDKTSYNDDDAGFWLGYDVDAYKLNIGDDTNYIKWDGENLIFTGHLGGVEAGDVLEASSDSIATMNISGLGVWKLAKKALIPRTGTYRISFTLWSDDLWQLACGRIYKDGIPYGIFRTNNLFPVTYYEDLFFEAGEYCEIYGTMYVWHTFYISEFRLYSANPFGYQWTEIWSE